MRDVIYRPPDILHWLDQGAKQSRKKAASKSKRLVATTTSDIAKGLQDAASVAANFGKGALTDLMKHRADLTTYVLAADHFEIQHMAGKKRVSYREVRLMRPAAGDGYEFVTQDGTVSVRPIAHLVAGHSKVPVGWSRNGLEVPYMTLVNEIAVRCGLEPVDD